MKEFDKKELTDLKIERANLEEVKGFQNEDGRLAHTVKEQKQIDILLKEVNVSIKVLEKEKKEFNAAVRLKKQMCMTAKNKLDTFRTNRGEERRG